MLASSSGRHPSPDDPWELQASQPPKESLLPNSTNQNPGSENHCITWVTCSLVLIGKGGPQTSLSEIVEGLNLQSSALYICFLV